jgi:hypothetical protein
MNKRLTGRGLGREIMFQFAFCILFFSFYVTFFICQINAKLKMKNAQWNINPDPPLGPLPCQYYLKNIDLIGRGK